MPSAGDGEYAVRLRDDAAGWRRVNGPTLTPDDPVLDGLTEAEANDLVEGQWALVHVDDEAATCTAIKGDGEVCGRDLPCPYHSDDEDESSED